MTPRILGVRHSERSDPSQVTCGLVRDWWVFGVNRVEWDFGMEMDRPFCRAHTATSVACDERQLAASSIFTADAAAVKSSAYDVTSGEVFG